MPASHERMTNRLISVPLSFCVVWLAISVVGCAKDEKKASQRESVKPGTERAGPGSRGATGQSPIVRPTARVTSVYWGDTHLHTNLSPDAFAMGTTSLGLDEAYRFAKGESLEHPISKKQIKLKTPLDFLVIADHAEMTGVPLGAMTGDKTILATQTGRRWARMFKAGQGKRVFIDEFGKAINENAPIADFNTDRIKRSAWDRIVAAADKHNAPGKFTALIGWEWTSTPGGKNLHRVVFTDAGATKSKNFLPYSSLDSDAPEDLWAWLDKTSKQFSLPFVAIPHNANVSGGLMFPLSDSEGKPLDAAYARMRMTWEPVVEVTQIKGDSEVHPEFSPNDEFAEFEQWAWALDFEAMKSGDPTIKPDRGDYVRSALLRGLEQQAKHGSNPYKFGLVGSTDAHTAMAAVEEDNFQGKFLQDGIAETKFDTLEGPIAGDGMSASGLAAVWASENTRSGIFDAFRRKETYATTGTRISLRFFGGWDYVSEDAQRPNLAEIGYQKGVPMGGDLSNAPSGKAPHFLIHTSKDPIGANLDRVQVVKGWLDSDGEPHEKVYDVAWSGDRRQGSDGKLPAVGNTVSKRTAKWDNSIGDRQLATTWVDPEFDPKLRSFYYVRVLEIPTPRHTLFAAIANGIEHPKNRPATIQERAYSSPIWYTP